MLDACPFVRRPARNLALAILLASAVRIAPATEPAPAPAAAQESFSIEATLVAGSNLNPNLQGHASPVVVRVFELKGTGAFAAADFQALFERPQQALGSELLSQQEFVLRPGEIRRYDHAGGPPAAALGLAAAFRTLDQDAWRLAVPLAQGAHNLLLIDFDDSKIRVPSLPGEPAGR